ncbi:ABC transporter permease [Sphaerisporangium sp. TRM90804]|uniref:ABC transporter permease n=1 Tax=Sphaerisporangium sp. TRM90804 TaxID=3031113 RepID=UPI0024468F33|nr:ABC transporter permease [Sphaerisporangium sp. TRM90804]MDH2429585.1 ABC transporter permease [Sphaerisporangium sp. TRM90804]
MSLVVTHTKYQFLETIRIPIAVIGNAFFPSASMLFFVVPFAGDDPVAATYATGSMMTFAVMASCLFTYGIGVSEDRAQPWDPYLRTLPAGPGPRFAGRLMTGLAFMAIALIPVVVIAALLTEANVSAFQVLLGLVALAAGAVPFTFLGLLIGYSLPSKAAIAVAQILFFPLAFGGGLLTSPQQAPAFIENIAPYLPTRGAVELVWAAIGDFTPKVTSLVMLAVWTVVTGVLATWAYRRDEGRRFS